MHFSSWAVCTWLLATPLPPQVLSVQVQDVITGSGGIIKASKTAYARWVNLNFGGTKHGTAQRGVELRPEAVKMQVCEELSSKCSDCTAQASCWRGVREGPLMLNVSASAAANFYSAEMWASCASGNGRWWVSSKPDKVNNGVIKIFVDGSLDMTVDASTPTNTQGNAWKNIAIAKNTRVRVVFERNTAGQAAHAEVRLGAVEVDEYVDECMSVKTCLEDLGDGSDSAFRLRNSNVEQLKCLVASSAEEQAAVSDHCPVWATCVSTSGLASKLKALLGAALTSRGSLEQGKINMQSSNNVEGCVDPSVQDPESWDCECMDEMTASCGAVNEECFAKILCENTNVCESWKGAHCAEFLLAKQRISIKASQNKSAILMRRLAKRAIATVDDRFDSALSGKCSQ